MMSIQAVIVSVMQELFGPSDVLYGTIQYRLLRELLVRDAVRTLLQYLQYSLGAFTTRVNEYVLAQHPAHSL